MKAINRRKFVTSAVCAGGFLGLDIVGKDLPGRIKGQQHSLKLKGQQSSLIKHWDVITIGNLSRNRYWGESDEKALRSAICTCTVITGNDFRLIVDPSVTDESAMTLELDRRTGLSPDDIDYVYITHTHGDHLYGLKHFKRAKWLAGALTAAEFNKQNNLPKAVEPASGKLFDAIDVIETKGHTPDHTSLRFDYKGLSIVVAGDAVATYDYWCGRRMYYNVLDPEEANKTLEKINTIADIVVPGHDNYFLNI